MKEALTLLGKVTGWGDSVSVTIAHREIDMFVSHDEVVGTGKWVFVCAVTICGEEGASIRGQGKSPEAAMLSCAKNVVDHHRQIEEWHRIKRQQAEKAIIASELKDPT